MAKAKLNPILLELHGKMGDVVFRRTRNREAAAYAKQLLSDPQVRAACQETGAKQGKRALEVAISEYLQQYKQ